MWEIVCGHQTRADVEVHDQITRIRKKYWSSEADLIPPKFESVTRLSATKTSDQEKILELLVSTFGSVRRANTYIRGILPSKWCPPGSKDGRLTRDGRAIMPLFSHHRRPGF